MLGIFVILLISWGLLYLIEKEHLDILGIIPILTRVSQFTIGFCFICLVILLKIYIETQVEEIEWKANEFKVSTLFRAFIYHIKSALTEDLVFRGAILYILIKRIGSVYAILLSSIVFGMYHWFSYGILNERWILLAYVFIVTGFTGYVWAYAFYKTKSIMIGLGFHLGYNFIMTCFFESQPYGELLFSQITKINLEGWNEFYLSLFKGLFPPFLMYLYVKFAVIEKTSISN